MFTVMRLAATFMEEDPDMSTRAKWKDFATEISSGKPINVNRWLSPGLNNEFMTTCSALDMMKMQIHQKAMIDTMYGKPSACDRAQLFSCSKAASYLFVNPSTNYHGKGDGSKRMIWILPHEL